MKKNIFILFLFTFFLKSFSLDYKLLDSLEWGSIDLPPIHNISKGEFIDLGCTDELISIFNSSFKIDKKPKIFPAKRFLIELKNSETLCNPFLKKTDKRSEILYYSKFPTSFIPTYVIIVTDKKYTELKSKTLSVEKILSDKNNKIGLQITRSYGKILDPIIKKYENNKNIRYNYNKNLYVELLNKLKYEKLDFIIALPMEIEYFAKKLDLSNFRYIKIEELKKSPYTVSYFGISKTKKGKKIIDQVNKILPKLRKTKNYKLAFERWIGKDLIKKYKKDYKNIFLKNRIR